MANATADMTPGQMSIVRGEPLDEKAGAGRLTIAAFAQEITARWGPREALVAQTPDGVSRWTYTDLWQRSMTIARALVAHGAGADTRVGVLMSNRPEFIASVFGIALAGGVAVAFNTFATASELDELLKISGVGILMFERRVAKRDFEAFLSELEPAIGQAVSGRVTSSRYPFLRRVVSLDDGRARHAAGPLAWDDFLQDGQAVPESVVEARAAARQPSDTATLFFSSGSTGMPKGILHSQRAVVLQWKRWPSAMGLSGDLRVWNANGFFWSGNFAMAIGCAFSSGGAIVLQSVFDPAEALALMQRERVNTPLAMPHQWGRIADEPTFTQTDLSSLRFFDPRFYKLRHPTMPTLYRQPQAFGCTETLTINTTTFFGESGLTRYEGHGLPLPGNILKIVDPLTGAIVPRGQKGEIAIKGATLMIGYLGKTAEECFDEEGFYRTGDGGWLDESGWLFWEGRLTDIIKTGGANVAPAEVDDAIRAFGGVKSSQTVGLPHDTLGEIVVSCVVPSDGVTLDEAALHRFLKDRLASYKLPRHILIVQESELQTTGSGNKIKTAEVRALALAKLTPSQNLTAKKQ